MYLAAPGLSFSRWDLGPWPGIQPTPPALAGGFLTTGPPGKSLYEFWGLFHVTLSELKSSQVVLFHFVEFE